MPILNLQKLLDSDNITQIVSKINENFNQLSINGGGPQGKPGYQGPPGLPGLTGRIGVAGDNGENGSKIIFTESDDNWGDENGYGYPLGPSTANIAVEDYGYNVGDTWIDNNNGYFYDIIEDTTPGNYLFREHRISPVVLSSGELWEADTVSNLDNTVEQGVRNRNRYSTLSLTSLKGDDEIDGKTADYTLIASASYISQNASVLGYPRKAFKLSIDNVSGDNIISRVSDGVGDVNTHYGKTNDDLVPLMYFSNADDFDYETTSFGLFISSYTDTNNNSNKISILTLASSANESTLDQLFIKTAKTGTSKELYFQNNESGSLGDAYISLLNVDNGGVQKTNPNSLWLGISTIASADLPFPGNEHTNLFGIETRYYNANGGKINFYVNRNGTAAGKQFVMSLTEKGGLALGTNTPNSLYSPDDNTNYHRFIVKSLGSDDATLKNIVAIMPNQSGNVASVASVGEKLVFGFLNTDSKTAIIRSIVSTSTNETEDMYQKLVLQPNGDIISTDNINAVGIGQEEPTAKLHIGGNLKIDEVKDDNGNILTYNEDKEVCKAVPSVLGIVEGSGTATQVAFWDDTVDQVTNKLSGNAKLYWDNENNILGIGFKAGSTPLSLGDTLTVKGNDDTDTVVSIVHSSNSTNNKDVKLNFTNEGHNTLASIGLTSSYYNPGGDIPDLAGFTDNRLKIYGANNIELATRNTNNFGGDGGNIFIRPANIGGPNPIHTGAEGVIILERRVQMIDPAVETSTGTEVPFSDPVDFQKDVFTHHIKDVFTHHIWTGISGNPSFLNDWGTAGANMHKIIHGSKSYDRIIKFTTKDLIFFIGDDPQNTAQNPPPIFIPYIIYTRKNGLPGNSEPYSNTEWNIHEKGLYSFYGGVVNTIIPAGYEYVIAFRAHYNEVGVVDTATIGISGQFIVYEHKFGKDAGNVVIPRDTTTTTLPTQ